MSDLFAPAPAETPRESVGHDAPLAERLRPANLGEVVGQDHLTGPDGAIGRMVAAGKLSSIVLWGPPGSGKTTLLTLISASVKTLKEAQSYMAFLMFLPILPTIILMVNPVKNALWMFATPFLAQNQLILMVLRSEAVTPLQWATYIGAGFGLGALLWLVAARLYHREQLAISA